MNGRVGSSAGEGPAGCFDVAAHLADQGLDRVELLLAAKPGNEADPGRLVVQVVIEIEQVGLEQRRPGIPVERGAATERDRGGMDLAAGSLIPTGVDAVGRQLDVARYGN